MLRESSDNLNESAASFCPSISCRRCRQKKVRCGMESPSCSRCVVAGEICVYPVPQNMKAFTEGFSRRLGQAVSDLRKMEVYWNEKMSHYSRTLCLSNIPASSELPIPPNWQIVHTPSGLSIQTDLRTSNDLAAFLHINVTKSSPTLLSRSSSRNKSPHPFMIKLTGPGSTYFSRIVVPDGTELRLPLPVLLNNSPAPPQSKLDGFAALMLYQRTMGNLAYQYLECFVYCKIVDRDAFLANIENGKMDQFLRWSVWAWTAKHLYTEHRGSSSSYLLLISNIAYAMARKLLEEKFDEPSIPVLLGLINMHSYSVELSFGEELSKDREIYFHLARLHLEKMSQAGIEASMNEMEREQFRRIAWAIKTFTASYQLYITRKIDLPNPISPEEVPRVLPHENADTKYFVEYAIYTQRLLHKMQDVLSRKNEFESPEELAFAGESVIREVEISLPDTFRVDNVDEITSPSGFGRVIEFETIMHMKQLQLFHNFFLQAAISQRPMDEWTTIEIYSYKQCFQLADRVVDLAERAIAHPGFCTTISIFSALVFSICTHQQILVSPSIPAEDKLKARQRHLNTLKILFDCDEAGLPYAAPLHRHVQGFFNWLEGFEGRDSLLTSEITHAILGEHSSTRDEMYTHI
ncbi:uncharacterized protein VTP21DRAFT_7094 [Calcarisporiella thermophila]|uniref:uncharacterized protein n=1 Tax=Calcarisporiella thermophila TaxID=911321 RepID=UPI00374327ED